MENLQIKQQDGSIFAVYSGEITLDIVQDLKSEILKAVEGQEATSLLLDLSGISFIDSSGIGFLVAMNTRMKNAGNELVICRPSTQVKKTLELVQLLDFFTIREAD
jgi:anti-sigma B factor antagonist